MVRNNVQERTVNFLKTFFYLNFLIIFVGIKVIKKNEHIFTQTKKTNSKKIYFFS
jgi:hypothetical protein